MAGWGDTAVGGGAGKQRRVFYNARPASTLSVTSIRGFDAFVVATVVANSLAARIHRRHPPSLLVTFILDNLLLVVLALASGGLLLWPLLKRGEGSATLSPLQATQLINHHNAVIVDIRDEKDFAGGSLAGARNLPDATLAERAGELVRFKARPLLIVCDSGQRSTRAIATFTGLGFTEVHALAGGIAAWKQAALPLVQSLRGDARVAKEPTRKSRNDNRGKPKALPSAVPAVVAAPAIVDEPAAANDPVKEIS